MMAAAARPGRAAMPGRTLILQATIVLAWLGAFLLGWLLEYAEHASLWFPPAAVTFAALLVLGARALPALWLACISGTWLAELIYGSQSNPGQLLLSGLVFAAVHTGAYAVPAWMLRLQAVSTGPFTTPRRVTVFLLGGVAAAGLAAVGGSQGLAATGMIPAGDAMALLVPWWIGDYAGLLTLGPLAAIGLGRLAVATGTIDRGATFGLADNTGLAPSGGRLLPKLLLLLGTGLAIVLVASAVERPDVIIFTLFTTVVIQLWIVHTESEMAALLGVAAFTLLLVVATTLLGLGDQAITLQFVLITLAANSYFGLAVPALYGDNQRLRQLLTHDALTGALTRPFFEDGVREALEAAQRQQRAAALVMVDLDRLKAINDRHGHAAGDAALRALARACAARQAPGQLFGRLGGDEFALFLPDSDAAAARVLIGRIRSALDQAGPGLSEPVTASFGIAVRAPGRSSYETLLAQADQEMYADKADGTAASASVPRRQAGAPG
jgi:diguanylate cyclase (GGDEF)-like protein